VKRLPEPAVETMAAVPAPVYVPPKNPGDPLRESPRVYSLAVVRKAFGTTIPH
jgi:hypothetical protein